MRYFFSMVFFVLFAPMVAHGQIDPSPSTQNQCVIISALNYGRCCAVSQTFNDSALSKRCEEYKSTGAISGPQGGSQSSNPINAGTDSTGAAPMGTTSTGIQQGTVSLNACSSIRFKSLIDILIWLKCVIVTVLIPLIFSVAFLVFLWGVFKFIAADDVKGKQEGQKVIWWGLIGLFVMVSVWGIIKILGTTLGIESTVPMLQTEYIKK